MFDDYLTGNAAIGCVIAIAVGNSVGDYFREKSFKKTKSIVMLIGAGVAGQFLLFVLLLGASAAWDFTMLEGNRELISFVWILSLLYGYGFLPKAGRIKELKQQSTGN